MKTGRLVIHKSGISGRLVDAMSEPTSLGINCDENPCIMTFTVVGFGAVSPLLRHSSFLRFWSDSLNPRIMIEGYVQIQKVTSYSVSWRNCWMRIDDKSIHLFYRPNCPPKGVKANKVLFVDANVILRLFSFLTVDLWIHIVIVTLTRRE